MWKLITFWCDALKISVENTKCGRRIEITISVWGIFKLERNEPVTSRLWYTIHVCKYICWMLKLENTRIHIYIQWIHDVHVWCLCFSCQFCKYKFVPLLQIFIKVGGYQIISRHLYCHCNGNILSFCDRYLLLSWVKAFGKWLA